MITTNIQYQTLKEIVTANFQAAAVFERYSLDFCCRGGKTIEQACAENGTDPLQVLTELAGIAHTEPGSDDHEPQWNPEMLIDHILQHHHAYVTKMVPVLYAHTQKVAAVHGSQHPETLVIARHFEQVAQELLQHMGKEEKTLFPYIRELHAALQTDHPAPVALFGSVRNPIRMMEAEHQLAGDAMYSIRSLSGNYAPPADACTTYRITYQELQEFEQDLHRHVHLENNILFPMALRLEQESLTNSAPQETV
ncbi:MAG: iron-sulfur cluster repair di-iron protein [Bacteroidetes bacterium]|nr:iron-sulfur cluster repair di-iron protein [Bacteroidota bacterium]